MRRTRLHIFVCWLIASFAAGCDGVSEERLTILDAADIYSNNRASFASIRAMYPGPFHEFARAPARIPEEQTDAENAFLENLRKSFPLEFIDMFPLADTGRDEIDVILQRYQENGRWIVISLVYSGIELPEPEAGANTLLFSRCDQQVQEAMNALRSAPSSGFCRLTQHWYASQRVY